MTDEKPPEQSTPTPIPETLPILPITDSVLFPKMVFPLLVMAPDSVQLVDETMSRDRIVGMVFAKPEETPDSPPTPGNYATVGTSAMILKMAKTPDNRTQLLVQGLGRFRIKQLSQAEGKPFWQAAVEHLTEDTSRDTEIEALMANIVNLFARIVQHSPTLPPEVVYMAQSIKEPGTLADMITSSLNATSEEKQKVLEILPVGERLKEVTRIVNKQLEILDLGKKIQDQVKGDMDKKQREYYLREQLKAIKTELGDKDEGTVEVDEYRTKVKEKDLPPEAAREAERELERLSRMHPSSAEYTVATTFLDWLTALPWHQNTADNLDIKKARKVLDDDHFGLEKPKRRIIEYLAVRKLKPDSKGPILCFVGPPGTGKTSLGQSIARALGRKFYRMSLGGVRDEAEIRGHRRTYVGAMPGRVIQGIRRAESNNPVFMLDEIDKLGADFRGDPSSALLEVLDPEQNNSFQDHYLDVPFDLSKVMFIATANILDTIPPALRDRMEVLQLLGYTQDEKVHIAERHLIAPAARGQRADRRQYHLHPRRPAAHHLGLHAGGGAAQPGAGDRHHLPRGGEQNRRGRDRLRSHQDPARREVPRARALHGRDQGAHLHPGGGDRLGVDPVRRRHPVRGSHRHEGQEPPDPDRSARRRHEGVRPGGAQLHPHERIQARVVRRDLREPGHPHPHPGRGHPQGRALGRRHHPHGHRLLSDQAARHQGPRHDRRNHPAGPGAAGGRNQG